MGRGGHRRRLGRVRGGNVRPMTDFAASSRPATGARKTAPAALSWPEARRVATGAGRRLAGVRRPLDEALGGVLDGPLEALTDLPAFDTSAMDGWAVAGTGPWRVVGEALAGQRPHPALLDGQAVRIATGAALPPGATAVIRREHGCATDDQLRASVPELPVPGQDIRPRGQECRAGDQLLPPGAAVTPAVLGLAAAAGYDELRVVPRPRVELLVLGDELLGCGLPRDGRVRDALGPLLPPWLRRLGAAVDGVRRLGDDAESLFRAVDGSDADLIVTTGGTASGPVDFVHPVLRRTGARLLVDGVAVRPGHPMLLAQLPDGRPFVGLPGNPLAAVSGVLTLVAPVLRALGGRPEPAAGRAALADGVPAHPTDTRLVPVALDDRARTAEPLRFHGPAMLRGLAAADAMAVIPPGGTAERGTEVEVLVLDWE
ncbi:molybdopterin molybdotransferase MoeA [Streptomyces silvisoli]|uniref:Molybdopterin molybdenumtransferase n=1 Tax=Streptomyces silvisoli TaxID=3034235 RepID=A0ABT5ZPF7_9ACTN|nr:molybdopterin molybdotransferase MoeA [Streptomyces silvisoli]MDF3290888.1 molybdopterin molybdotransferase MoeA [Streptomyces silvisoli]